METNKLYLLFRVHLCVWERRRESDRDTEAQFHQPRWQLSSSRAIARAFDARPWPAECTKARWNTHSTQSFIFFIHTTPRFRHSQPIRTEHKVLFAIFISWAPNWLPIHLSSRLDFSHRFGCIRLRMLCCTARGSIVSVHDCMASVVVFRIWHWLTSYSVYKSPYLYSVEIFFKSKWNLLLRVDFCRCALLAVVVGCCTIWEQ